MAGVLNDLKGGLRQCLVKVPRVLQRADHVVSSVHDVTGDIEDPVCVAEQLVGCVEEPAVNKVVAFDSGERLGEVGLGGLRDVVGVGNEVARRAFPDTPRLRASDSLRLVITGESSVVGGHQIVSLVLGNGRQEVFPLVRVDPACAFLVVPVDFLWAEHEDAPQHELRDAVWVGLSIGERERASLMNVLGVRRNPDHTQANVYAVDHLHSLLPKADVLFICLPLTSATENLIAEQEIALMPARSILINVGRAKVVNENALYSALRDGHLHSAGLDVWYHYPKDESEYQHTPPANLPFHELPNVVMSPHRAAEGGSDEVQRLRMASIAESLNTFAKHHTMPHPVDLDAGY